MSVFAPVIAEPPVSASPRPLRIAVLVDLQLSAGAGGHVKCWERLAQAATAFPRALDLTVYFMGHERQLKPIGDNVRYVIEPPVFSTERLPFLSHVPDHTDLAPWHPRVAQALAGHDVIHTTDAYFSYARTAMRVSRRRGVPVVNSVHTDTPQYARIFTTQTMEHLLGKGRAAQCLIDRLGVPRFAERHMLRRLAAHQRACASVLVSRPDQLASAAALTGGRAGLLRRGVDLDFFTPAKRDRDWLAAKFGIPQESALILFAGRVNPSKNAMLLAEAVGTLVGRGQKVHLFCAGEGEQRAAIGARLGSHATCPGNIPPETLARVYASADLFAFPSPVEECANVTLEALASGLPVMVARESGMGRIIVDGKTGFALSADRPFAWARFIDMLATDPARRATMARQARSYAERQLPSWREVLGEDLLPTWQKAALTPRPAA